MNIILEKEPHIVLHHKIVSCKCQPWRKGIDYCRKCQYAVIEFMNNYGSGVLTNDITIEELLKDNIQLDKDNNSLRIKLEAKIKRVEELKKCVKSQEKAP